MKFFVVSCVFFCFVCSFFSNIYAFVVSSKKVIYFLLCKGKKRNERQGLHDMRVSRICQFHKNEIQRSVDGINLKGEPLNFHSRTWRLNYLFCWMVAPEHKPYSDSDLVLAIGVTPFSYPTNFLHSFRTNSNKSSKILPLSYVELYSFNTFFLHFFDISFIFFVDKFLLSLSHPSLYFCNNFEFLSRALFNISN